MRHLAVLLVGLLLAGCAVGPDFHQPAPPKSQAYAPEALPPSTAAAPSPAGAAETLTTGLDVPGQWWTLFGSQNLDDLMASALLRNPDLQSAQAALRAALEGVYAQEGFYFPTIAGNFSASRNHNASEISPTLNVFVPYFNLYSADVSASWTLDIWGQNRRQVESLRATAAATQDQLEAAYLTLTASLAAAAIQEASLRGQIDVTDNLIDIDGKMLDILKHQLATGYENRIDVAVQEAQLAAAKATLPPLQKQLAQTRDLIAALAGEEPGEKIEQTFTLSQLKLPAELPVSVPAALVGQRPDVKAAADNLHAASAQIGVAIANMLPNLTISAGDGTIATEIDQLFAPGNGYRTIAAGVTQPLFDGGTLLHRERGARAAYDQAEAEYRSTVIAALQNVADTLHAVLSDADALKADVDADKAAKLTLDLTTQQRNVGYVNYLVLLSAEQAYDQAELNLVQAEAARFSDAVMLYQAMGGGGWNRKDVVPYDSGSLKDISDLLSGR